MADASFTNIEIAAPVISWLASPGPATFQHASHAVGREVYALSGHSCSTFQLDCKTSRPNKQSDNRSAISFSSYCSAKPTSRLFCISHQKFRSLCRVESKQICVRVRCPEQVWPWPLIRGLMISSCFTLSASDLWHQKQLVYIFDSGVQPPTQIFWIQLVWSNEILRTWLGC